MQYKNKLKELNKMLEDLNYEPDAVGISSNMLPKIIHAFQQEFEIPFVKLSDIESYLDVKILLFEEGSSKKEFYFYSELREGDS